MCPCRIWLTLGILHFTFQSHTHKFQICVKSHIHNTNSKQAGIRAYLCLCLCTHGALYNAYLMHTQNQITSKPCILFGKCVNGTCEWVFDGMRFTYVRKFVEEIWIHLIAFVWEGRNGKDKCNERTNEQKNERMEETHTRTDGAVLLLHLFFLLSS